MKKLFVFMEPPKIEGGRGIGGFPRVIIKAESFEEVRKTLGGYDLYPDIGFTVDELRKNKRWKEADTSAYVSGTTIFERIINKKEDSIRLVFSPGEKVLLWELREVPVMEM